MGLCLLYIAAKSSTIRFDVLGLRDRSSPIIPKVKTVSTLLTRNDGDVLLAYFQDVRIIDESRINSLGQELGDLITSDGSQRIILNFKNVSFMSSAMIGKLVLFGKKCKTAKIALRMCDINDNVEEVFNLMKLGKVLAIDKTEEAAIKNINKKSWLKG